jgi:hypothetical protein
MAGEFNGVFNLCFILSFSAGSSERRTIPDGQGGGSAGGRYGLQPTDEFWLCQAQHYTSHNSASVSVIIVIISSSQ